MSSHTVEPDLSKANIPTSEIIINLGPEVVSNLTMDEIIEKVTKNETIPGIRQIEAKIHETGSLPTMIPRKKPWEH